MIKIILEVNGTMNVDELLNVLNNLASIAEFKELSSKEYTEYHLRFGLDSPVIFCGKEKVKQFKESVDKIWRKNDCVYQTFSKGRVEEEIVNLIRTTHTNDKYITESEVQELFDKLLKSSKEDIQVFRRLYGARLSTLEPLELGNFTIYNWEKHQSTIIEKYPDLVVEHRNKFFIEYTGQHLLISVKISTRDPSRAEELADLHFRRFENIVRYMIADKEDNLDVGIFDYYSWNVSKSILLSTTTLTILTQAEGAYEPIDIDDPFFKDSSNGHQWIWDIFSQLKPSKMQERVIAAIEWVGKGRRDPDSAKALVQFVFAIEALLTFQKKGVLVSPGIASQLAEYSAFILGSDYDSRLQVEKSVKKLYSHRSAVAHGGSQSVLKSEVYEALWLVKSLITRMITEQELLAMTSIDQLQEWVSRQKYS